MLSNTIERKKSDWASYKDFLSFISKTFHVIRYNQNNWKMSMCSCWYWCKNYKCKHVTAVAYRAKNSNKLNNFNWSIEHKTVQLGQKRKPGRPTLMKKAL